MDATINGTINADISAEEIWERLVGDGPVSVMVNGVEKAIVTKAEGCTTKEYLSIIGIISKGILDIQKDENENSMEGVEEGGRVQEDR